MSPSFTKPKLAESGLGVPVPLAEHPKPSTRDSRPRLPLAPPNPVQIEVICKLIGDSSHVDPILRMWLNLAGEGGGWHLKRPRASMLQTEPEHQAGDIQE